MKQKTNDKILYRWVLIDNQETCFCSIVKIIDGWWENEEEAKAEYIKQSNHENIFNEYLFRVQSIDFSATPNKLIKSIT